MSVMPGTVAKPPLLERLDQLSSDKVEFETAYNDLKTTNPTVNDLIQWGWNHDLIETKAEENHLRNHWLGNWWPTYTTKEAVIKHGLLKAFELAIDQQKHFDCYWVCSGAYFQVLSLLSPHQVTVLVLTPSPGYLHTNAFPDAEDIWAAKEKPATPVPGQQEESAADGAHVVRLLKNRSLP